MVRHREAMEDISILQALEALALFISVFSSFIPVRSF